MKYPSSYIDLMENSFIMLMRIVI